MPRPVKRSVTISGHSTSVSLEPEFWDALKDIASQRRISIAALLQEIDATRRDMGLSTAARLHALEHYRSQSRGLSEKMLF